MTKAEPRRRRHVCTSVICRLVRKPPIEWFVSEADGNHDPEAASGDYQAVQHWLLIDEQDQQFKRFRDTYHALRFTIERADTWSEGMLKLSAVPLGQLLLSP